MKRVVITGMSMLTPIGNNWKTVYSNLKNKKNGVVYMDNWEKYTGLFTRLAAPIKNLEIPEHFTRKKTRSMGRVAILSTHSAEQALDDAKLLNETSLIRKGQAGVAYGSSSGSIDAIIDFYSMLKENIVQGITATTYIKMMPHTCAANIGVYFGLTGRFIPSGTACTSGSIAIGYAYETIKNQKQKIMIAGGAEELNPTQAVVFDTLYATSTKNDTPHLTPRPFDRDRDGLVIGEGAGTVILEELEQALERKAPIYAEIVGFGSNTDGKHITQPNMETMKEALRLSLKDASLLPKDIDYVNAHGTSTAQGDIAESHATHQIFGPKIPISSQKSYIGHTLGGCGAIESIMTIHMMNNNWFAPTVNLENVDEKCATLDYLKEAREMECEYAMNNNFAFGGINTSLIFKKWKS